MEILQSEIKSRNKVSLWKKCISGDLQFCKFNYLHFHSKRAENEKKIRHKFYYYVQEK